jgi:hypothetical protein
MSKVISFTGENLGHAAVVAECEVTLDRLHTILDATVITAEPDRDGLYISEGTTMPLWVHVQPEHKLIALVPYHDTAVVEASVGAAAANRLNGTPILASATILPHLRCAQQPNRLAAPQVGGASQLTDPLRGRRAVRLLAEPIQERVWALRRRCDERLSLFARENPKLICKGEQGDNPQLQLL